MTSFNCSTMEQSAMFRSGNDRDGITLSTLAHRITSSIIIIIILNAYFATPCCQLPLQGIFFFNYDRYQYLI